MLLQNQFIHIPILDTRTGPPNEVLDAIDLKEKADDSSTETDDDTGADVTDTIDDVTIDAKDDGKLVEEEEQEEGVVRMAVYMSYWKAVGNCLAPIVLMALFLMQGMCC